MLGIATLETRLRAISELDSEKAERIVLHSVESLERHRTAAALGALLAQVRDTEHDMMEVIMHAAERFPPKLYVTALAREIVALHTRAPYRTSIYVSRILQSAGYLAAFMAALEGAGPEIQSALAEMFGRIKDDRPDLGPLMNRVSRDLRERKAR